MLVRAKKIDCMLVRWMYGDSKRCRNSLQSGKMSSTNGYLNNIENILTEGKYLLLSNKFILFAHVYCDNLCCISKLTKCEFAQIQACA